MQDFERIENLESWDAQKANEQIEVRYNLVGQMVGTLYPTILFDEIERIQDHIDDLGTLLPKYPMEEPLPPHYISHNFSSIRDGKNKD